MKFTYQQMLTDLVNKNYKLSYMNIIYREIMVRLMHKKYSKFLMMKYSVLLFINLALVFFTKIVSTLYTGLYISFLFSHINITHPKNVTTTVSENTGGKQMYKKKKRTLEKVAGPKHGFLHKTKIQ